jgi:ATP-dependent RNA helicase SUPV3L1/SUV3
VLDHASRENDVRQAIRTPLDVERLWEVCQIPDYRKIAPANHAELAVTVFGYLMRDGKIDNDWFAQQVAQADRTDGDIDTLSTRIAHIRTWTFAANRPDWLADPEHWQGVTRAVEDKLSDALHERLIERFVDRRTSVLMRRLRENDGLEPEINKAGDVVVEGHVIGRLDGFLFVADASSGGSEAKALQNAAQKALTGEIGVRATRLAEAPDDQFVLATDGTIRWTGAAVGKLIAGEQVLRPRVRVIADEHLTGAPRDAVDARLDKFVKSHLEKLLGPLFVLSAAEDVTGIARGVAFQLVEALGALDRQKVADDVKGLEQPSRATLRKYGVRFGAYHIYIPALLKPGPRALATQLFALTHEGPESKGLDELLTLAGSGRTSIPFNREIDPALYRTAGYRVCGERAVRVDILERLADLIRPALAWRESATGPKPSGAFPGGGFTVFNGMTSLTGASGEDFASILRSLGYRMEKRPKPPEPKVEAATAVIEASAEVQSPPADAEAVVDDAAHDIGNEAAALEAVGEAGGDDAAQQAPVETSLLPAVDLPTTSAFEPAPAAMVETASEAPQPPSPAEPELVEVWRPGRAGRPEGNRRPRFRHRDAGKSAARDNGQQTPAVAAADAQPVEQQPAGDSDKTPERQRHHRRHRPDQHRPEQRFDRQQRDRPPRERDRQSGKPPRFERREKAPDPNSPFAKLAALKAQLEADAKERH